MKPILGILGPTAVGKSRLALELAQKLNTEIISADSMQIYKGFDIGTAKPTKEEQSIVKHHLIDIVNPNESFSSYLFKKEAENILQDFDKRNLIPLIVGGTGFFFKNLLYQFDFEEGSDTDKVRENLMQLKDKNGTDYMFSLLRNIDPQSAEIIHPNDIKKVLRALEIYYTTGRTKSSGQNNQKPRYAYKLFVLNRSREDLYNRINIRVDEMIANGLVEEVHFIYKTISPNSQSLQGIGYKELIAYFNGECDLSQSIELIKQHSRNYAKRQITFYKKMDAIWLDATLSANKLIHQILEIYNKE
jgi:tRNA dimethylallyltransferase